MNFRPGSENMQRKNLLFIFSTFIFILFSSHINVKSITAENSTSVSKSSSSYTIVVDLSDYRLFLINTETKKIIKSYPIACGKPATPSPVGTFKIVDKGVWANGFGTRWMGFNVPWGRYGIHGTNKPYSIGTASSQGCIRMHNNDVEDLYPKVRIGTTVIIYGGPCGLLYNTRRVLLPGNTGTDVLEVQRVLKQRGYYKGSLNGIYNDSTKEAVLSFKSDHKLHLSNEVDLQMYKLLDIVPFE